MKKNRSTLKDYFKKGAIPTDSNFADLIDSMLNQDEDNISKLPNDPLRVTATGADEALLNFYRVEQNEEKLTWQVKQKPDGKPGLNISDTAASRFFIENGSGNIGIGTTTPKQALDVRGRMNIEDGVIQRGGDPITGTKDLGLYSQGEGYWIRIVTKNAPIRFFTDGGIGTKISLSVETDKVKVNSNLQVAGNMQLDGNQKIFFSDTDTTNNLKIQLWSGYGLGINGSTLFYAANGQHSWRDNNGTNERMLLTTGADGGLTVRGTGPSSFAGSLGIGTSDVGSFKLSVNGNGYFRGSLSLGNSDIYFTKTDHDHTGFGNTDGYAAIENAKNYDALMILGRAHTGGIRTVKLWDYLEVNGNLRVTGYVHGNQVYFSAYLDSNSRSGDLNPVPMQVASQNIGNCYNTNTSKFTAPVKGVYLFTLGGLRSEGSGWLHWFLMVNGKYANPGGTSTAESNERCLVSWTAENVYSSRTIVLSLNKDDSVWVQQSGSGRCDNFRSGFEGVLLSADLG